MTEINITDGDNGTIIVTAPESSTCKFSIEIMDDRGSARTGGHYPKHVAQDSRTYSAASSGEPGHP